MFGIAATGGRRGQTHLDWRIKATIFSIATTVAGVACGVALGFLGELVPEDLRLLLVSLLALVLLSVGLLNLRPGARTRLLERNCETAQTWLHHGPIAWAILNGAALGSGFQSRIGFVSWYLVPLAAIGFADPLAGALVYGLYGATRGFAVWAWIVAPRFVLRMREIELSEVVLELNPDARYASAAVAVVFSASTVVAVGL